MKILLIHNFYQLPGGEDQVFAQETELLRGRGHQVLVYQASNEQVKGQNPLVTVANTIWNQRIHRELRELMHREKPDIVHVHNTFQVISPAIYYAANEEGIPVVRATPNGISALISPNGHLDSTVPRRVAGVIDGFVPPADPPTVFSRFGLWTCVGFGVFLGACGAAAKLTTKRIQRPVRALQI